MAALLGDMGGGQDVEGDFARFLCPLPVKAASLYTEPYSIDASRRRAIRHSACYADYAAMPTRKSASTH